MNSRPGISAGAAPKFLATQPQDLENVVRLLQGSFHVSSSDPSLDRKYLSWKYYQPGPAWTGSRSYVLCDGGRFLAHAAIWPVQLRLRQGIRCGIGFGDWAADEEHRGIGLILVKKLVSLASFTMATGGRDITRQILPRMGFQPWGDRSVYARVLHPLMQYSTRVARSGWKGPLRMARNYLWSRSPTAAAANWTARETDPNEQTLALGSQQPGSVHSVEFIRFLLTCPTAQFRYFEFLKKGIAQGYAVVSEVSGQARLTAVRIASEAQEDWNAALAVLVRALKKSRTVCEAVAFGSTPIMDEALQANGFRVRDQRPTVVFDPEGTITQEPLPFLGMLDDDSSFLSDPQHPFMT